MATQLFSMAAKRIWSTVLSVAVAVTSLGFSPRTVQAATLCLAGSLAFEGKDPNCHATKVGGNYVTFPKLQWQQVAVIQQPSSGSAPSTSDQLVSLGVTATSQAASALGLDPSEVAAAASQFPSNLPYVLARYNPLDLTLMIDIFKVEKTFQDGQARVGLYHATFTPAHGNAWAAARSYISPAAFRSGVTPGVNPFATFAQAGSNAFHDISLTGAQVAVGHAMRMVGAPVSLMSVVETRFSQRKKKSGNAFKRKVEVWTYGHAKSTWLIGMPAHLQNRSSSYPVASFCATDPSASSCPAYQVATAGVTFEEYEGGNLPQDEDKWQVDYTRRSGLGFLSIVAIAVVASFALSGLLASSGLISAGAGTGAGAGAGSASGVLTGSFGSFLVNSGLTTAFSTSGAIAVETAYVAGALALGGANLSSVIKPGVENLLGRANEVNLGSAAAPELSTLQRKLNNQVSPRTTSALGAGADNTISSVKAATFGECGPTSTLAQCRASGKGDKAGFVPRADQYIEHGMVQYIADNDGQILRTARGLGDVGQ